MSASSSPRLLVVDDEPDLRTLYELTLLREGYDVETAADLAEAWDHLQGGTYDAVITDMRLPDGSGLDLLQRLESAGRAEKAIVITAYGSAENAVAALKAGAYDYLTKPVDLRQFRSVVAAAVGRGAAAASPDTAGTAAARGTGTVGTPGGGETGGGAGGGPGASPPSAYAAPAPGAVGGSAASAARAGHAAPHPGIESSSRALRRMVGSSAAIQQVRALIEKVARSMAPVWVHGESGTGKELVARAIHEVSPRAAAPFVAVNCGAIPEQLLEAEFFGYRKGAFTGANEDREGFFQAATGGTLFLDEIGDLPLSMQSKLLRSIQERAVRAVGATAELPVDVRIISATHKDLAAEVEAGRFRQDLYYRLNVIQIRVPPLRERLEDLESICDQILSRIARESGNHESHHLGPGAAECLKQHAFQGNVRELENLLHRAVALSAGAEILPEDLGLAARQPGGGVPAHPDLALDECGLPVDLTAYLDAVEKEVLLKALEHHRNNRTAAGVRLGLTLRQMRYRMARLGIVPAGAAEAADDADDTDPS